jgi:hypothetical protein
MAVQFQSPLSIVSHNVVQLAMEIATISGAGLIDQRATTGRLIIGPSLKGAMVSSVMYRAR